MSRGLRIGQIRTRLHRFCPTFPRWSQKCRILLLLQNQAMSNHELFTLAQYGFHHQRKLTQKSWYSSGVLYKNH